MYKLPAWLLRFLGQRDGSSGYRNVLALLLMLLPLLQGFLWDDH